MSTADLLQEKLSIALPPPEMERGGTLMQALKARRSTREFATKPLPVALLSTLLWAAFGINRAQSGGRTAPSAHGWKEIEIFAALPDGVYRYDAIGHALRLAVPADVRALTGTQEFVRSAPLDLVYVADFSRMPDASAEDRAFFAGTDAAVIAENVYLFCASAGLVSVVRGLIDRRALARAMSLRPDQRIVLAQTVGYPAS
jgi:nitroreductase